MFVIKVLIFVFFLVSCGENPDEPQSDGNQGTTPPVGAETGPDSSAEGSTSEAGAVSGVGAVEPGSSSSGGEGAVVGGGVSSSSASDKASSGKESHTRLPRHMLPKFLPPPSDDEMIVREGEKYYTLSHQAGGHKAFHIYVEGAAPVQLNNGDCLLLKSEDFETLDIDWGLRLFLAAWQPYCGNSFPPRKGRKTLCGKADHYALLRQVQALISRGKPAETSHCKTLERVSN